MTDKTMTLEPCPFCGRMPIRGRDMSGDLTLYNVRCRCGAGVNDFFDEQESITAWNTRHLSQPADRGEAVPVDERCPHGVRHPHPCRECEDGAPIRDDLYRAALNASGCIFRWRTSGIQPSYREFMATEEALDKAIHARLTAPPPAAGVPDEQVASFVEKAGEIIGGKPFPSGKSLSKAREICDLALAMLSATPSPTIDVAAVRAVIGELRGTSAMLQSELMDSADKLARAIGDAK